MYPFDASKHTKIDLGNSSITKPTAAITFGYWLRTNTDDHWILSHVQDGTFRQGFSNWAYTNGRDVPMICQNGFGSNGIHYRVGHTDCSDGSWHHHVFTWTSGTAVKIYIDGAEETTYDADYPGGGNYPTAISYGSSHLMLGVYAPLSYYCTGDMADFFLCNVALTPGEIAELYHRRCGWTWTRGLQVRARLPWVYGVDPSTLNTEWGQIAGTVTRDSYNAYGADTFVMGGRR